MWQRVEHNGLVTRDLVSDRDFQFRYALFWTLHLALARTASSIESRTTAARRRRPADELPDRVIRSIEKTTDRDFGLAALPERSPHLRYMLLQSLVANRSIGEASAVSARTP